MPDASEIRREPAARKSGAAGAHGSPPPEAPLPRLLTAAVGLAVGVSPCVAQSVAETVWDDLKHAPGDFLHVYTAPLRIDGGDLPELGLFLGVTGLTLALDGEIQELVRDHPNSVVVRSVEPFRFRNRILSNAGRSHNVMRAAAALYVLGLATGSRDIREAGLGCATANQSNALVRQGVYALIARKRPAGEDDPYQFDVPGGEWDMHSFFGGHAANPLTCVSFWSHSYDLGLAEPLLYGLAVGIGLGRLVDENHWASDTVVGMAFGWAVGRLVAERFRERREGTAGESEGASDDARPAPQGRSSRHTLHWIGGDPADPGDPLRLLIPRVGGGADVLRLEWVVRF